MRSGPSASTAALHLLQPPLQAEKFTEALQGLEASCVSPLFSSEELQHVSKDKELAANPMEANIRARRRMRASRVHREHWKPQHSFLRLSIILVLERSALRESLLSPLLVC